MTNQTGKTQSYGSTTTTSQGINYNTPAIQVGNQVRDGDEFILITRNPTTGSTFQVWSSGDGHQTEQLYRQAAKQVKGLETMSS